MKANVAVAPRSPIGYNIVIYRYPVHEVAVAPRSPIGYNSQRVVAVVTALRLLPDLPSAIIHGILISSWRRCGCSPISHRL